MLKMIFGFFSPSPSPRRGQIKNLEDVNSILLVLPGNNDVDVVSSVSFVVLDYHESPCLSHLGCLIIMSPLASHIWGAWLSWIPLPLTSISLYQLPI